MLKDGSKSLIPFKHKIILGAARSVHMKNGVLSLSKTAAGAQTHVTPFIHIIISNKALFVKKNGVRRLIILQLYHIIFP